MWEPSIVGTGLLGQPMSKSCGTPFCCAQTLNLGSDLISRGCFLARSCHLNVEALPPRRLTLAIDAE